MPKNLNFVTRIFLISLLIFSTILLSKFILEGLGGANLSNFNLPPPRIQRAITTFLFAIFLFFLIPSKITFWTIVFPLSLIATVYRPIAYIYGPPDYQAMVSAFSTTFSEAKEFLCLIPASLYLKSLLIPVTASIAYYLARLTGIKPWKNKTLVLISLSLLIISLEPTLFFRKTFNAGEETKEQLAMLQKYIKNPLWGKTETTSLPKDYVLIIGESARKDYFHIYGYPVPNTPFLDRANSTVVNGMKSAGTYTIASLTRMLTLPNKQKWEADYGRTLIDLAKSAGIETYWISTQGVFGQFDTPVTAIAKKSDHSIFLNSNYEERNVSDLNILKEFQKIVKIKSHKPRLIVLHTMGSHPLVCRRILDIKDPYLVTDSNLDTVACYVTSIKKTDLFIEKVYEILEKQKDDGGNPFSIIYFSDHGQVHTQTSSQIKIHNNAVSKLHYDIPLIKIDSGQGESVTLESQKSGLNFTEGLAHWMGIKNDQLSEYDLFDGKNDPEDYGLKEKIKSIKTPLDKAIDISPYLKEN